MGSLEAIKKIASDAKSTLSYNASVSADFRSSKMFKRVYEIND